MEQKKTLELLNKGFKIEIASDENDGLGIATVKGKISEADIVNYNDFLITHDEWEDMLNSPLNQERLKKGQLYGCVGHDARPVDNQDIRKGEVSHIIKDLWMEGNDVMCTATILDTSSGRNLLACLKGGGFMQASTRLSVDETNLGDGIRGLVGANSEILTVDFVIDPAIPSTYIQLASKDTEVEEENIVEDEVQDIELSSVELNTNLNFYKELLKKEQEKNKILKGNR